jgi:hypothetical protein
MNESNLQRENMVLKARVRQLQNALRQQDRRLELMFDLPETLSNFFGLLLSKEYVSKDLAQREMNVVADAQVAVWRLRKALEPHGVRIHTRRKLGWYLDEETKQRVIDMMARKPIGAVNGEGEESTGQAEDASEADTGNDDFEIDAEDSYGSEHYDADGYDYGSESEATGKTGEHDQASATAGGVPEGERSGVLRSGSASALPQRWDHGSAIERQQGSPAEGSGSPSAEPDSEAGGAGRAGSTEAATGDDGSGSEGGGPGSDAGDGGDVHDGGDQ